MKLFVIVFQVLVASFGVKAQDVPDLPCFSEDIPCFQRFSNPDAAYGAAVLASRYTDAGLLEFDDLGGIAVLQMARGFAPDGHLVLLQHTGQVIDIAKAFEGRDLAGEIAMLSEIAAIDPTLRSDARAAVFTGYRRDGDDGHRLYFTAPVITDCGTCGVVAHAILEVSLDGLQIGAVSLVEGYLHDPFIALQIETSETPDILRQKDHARRIVLARAGYTETGVDAPGPRGDFEDLVDFQQENCLPRTGTPDRQTISVLHSVMQVPARAALGCGR